MGNGGTKLLRERLVFSAQGFSPVDKWFQAQECAALAAEAFRCPIFVLSDRQQATMFMPYSKHEDQLPLCMIHVNDIHWQLGHPRETWREAKYSYDPQWCAIHDATEFDKNTASDPFLLEDDARSDAGDVDRIALEHCADPLCLKDIPDEQLTAGKLAIEKDVFARLRGLLTDEGWLQPHARYASNRFDSHKKLARLIRFEQHEELYVLQNRHRLRQMTRANDMPEGFDKILEEGIIEI
ncbi:hypothetical protein Plhal304r1_c015g0055481 [Plasmopara halstedii]